MIPSESTASQPVGTWRSSLRSFKYLSNAPSHPKTTEILSQKDSSATVEWVVSVVLFVAASLVYLLFRPLSLAMFDWFPLREFPEAVVWLRRFAALLAPPEFLVYNFPFGAWIFSGTLAMSAVWKGRSCRNQKLWIAVIPIIGIGAEGLQFLQWVPGTFDYVDLIFCCVAGFLALVWSIYGAK